MKHTTFSILLTLAAVLASLANAQQPISGQKPNIVYIVADDLGWKDVASTVLQISRHQTSISSLRKARY